MKKNVKIFMFSDALGYELVQKYAFMTDRLPFRCPVETQFGYSSTALPTIMTGRPPTEHGRFSFFYYDRAGKSPFRFFRKLAFLLHPRKIFDHHRVRNRISAWLKKHLGYTGYFNLYRVPYERLPYFDYCEKTDMFAPHSLPVENLYDMLAKTGLKFHLSDWRKNDAENIRIAKNLLEQGEVDFIFLYTASIDGQLHFHVSEPDYVKKMLDGFALDVSALLDAAHAHYEHAAFYLFSDHGMTPLTGSADLKKCVEALDWKFGKDYVACYDSTMLRVWFLNPACRKEILDSVRAEKGHWLSPDEKKALHIDFADARYGEEIFLMDPGIQIVPSDMGAKAIPGMHGFTPADKDSMACLLAEKEPPFIPHDIAGYFQLMREEARNLS